MDLGAEPLMLIAQDLQRGDTAKKVRELSTTSIPITASIIGKPLIG